MALMLDQIDDFVAITIDNFKRGKFVDIFQTYQEYISAKVMQKKVPEQGGPQITWPLKKSSTGNARLSGLYDVDQTNVTDVMIQASVPWRFMTTSWAYDLREEVFQSDHETIVNILVAREMDAKFDLVELHEELLWTETSSASDNRPWTLPFWMQADSGTTATDGDFTGGNPTGYSGGAAGVDSTVYPKWKNFAFNYVTVSTNDFVKKFKKALVYTKFKAPVPHPQLGYGATDRVAYTTYPVVAECERLAETRNDNLGSDLAKYMNQVTIGGVPLETVMYLTANETDDPVYGVDWGTLRPVFRKGWNMKRSGPREAPHQHNVRKVHYDTSMNYMCYDRRKLFRAKRVAA